MTKDNFKDQYGQYLDDFEAQDDFQSLWEELEPRLERKKKRRFIWLLFSLPVLMVFSIYLFQDDDYEVAKSNIERIEIKDTPQHLLNNEIGKGSDEESEIVHKILQPIRNSKDIGKSDQHPRLVTTYIESDNPKKTDQDNTMNNSYPNEFTDVTIPVTASSFDDRKPEMKSVLQHTVGVLQRLEMLSTQMRLLEVPKYQVKSPSMPRKLVKKSPVNQNYFVLDQALHYARFGRNEDVVLTAYGEQIDGTLSLKGAYSSNLRFSSTQGNGLNYGLGLRYTHIIEEFRLNNQMVEEVEVFNEEAFRLNGNYLGANQMGTRTLTQKVYNRNAFKTLDMNLVLGYKLGSTFKYGFNVFVDFLLFQDYSGSLIDEEGWLIKSGAIFEDRKMNRISYGLQYFMEHGISERWYLSMQAHYQLRSFDNSGHNNFNNDSLHLYGLGFGLAYRLN